MSPEVWTVLLPVIVGGLLALLPGAVLQLVTHVLSERTSRAARNRARFEELMIGLALYEQWLDTRRNEIIFGQAPTAGTSPWPKIVAIAAVDFPQLLPNIDAVELKAAPYLAWMHSRALERMKGNIAVVNEGFNAVYEPFAVKLRDLNQSVRAAAKALTKT